MQKVLCKPHKHALGSAAYVSAKVESYATEKNKYSMKSKIVEKSEDSEKSEEIIYNIVFRLNELHEQYIETKESTPYS